MRPKKLVNCRNRLLAALAIAVGFLGLVAGCAGTGAKAKGDPYASFVWPPPPDEPRIRLQDILHGRADLETDSGFEKLLFGVSPREKFDWLGKPFGVDYDSKGRLLVTDPAQSALFRFDRPGRKVDVLGTTGALHLIQPLGLGVGPDGSIYVADAKLKKVVVFDPEGTLRSAFGREGQLVNPTDAAVNPEGTRLFVADSKAHRIVVFDLESGAVVLSIGNRGEKEGEFNFPSALTFDRGGNLYIVDQINARVQIFSQEGEYLDSFGGQGVAFGNFVRPKDVAIDEAGLVYVTDAALNNIQIFDSELRLLTFVGAAGAGPGQFQTIGSVAVRGRDFAAVDQLGRRVQVFRFLVPKETQ